MDDFLDIHFNSKLYLSKLIIKPNYNIGYSDFIDDSYWNFAYLKNNQIDFNDSLRNIVLDMKNLHRIPTVYITSNIINPDLMNSIHENNLKILYTDVWMSLENLDNFKAFNSSLDFKTQEVGKLHMNSFIQAVMTGFSGDNPEDPYESLSLGYKLALKKSFTNNNYEYRIIHYAGFKNGNIISTATVVYKNSSAILYNITTNKNFQGHGVCKQMMYDIIGNLKKLGVNKICVQTEEGFYPEQIYKKFGFEKFMTGTAYIKEE